MYRKKQNKDSANYYNLKYFVRDASGYNIYYIYNINKILLMYF